MAAIIPVSCKSGVCILASQHVFGESWSANLEIENDEYKHYEMTPDTNSLIWSQIITSFSRGTATLRAKFDNTPGARLDSNKNIILDKGGTGYLGFTSTIGLVITYTITAVRYAQDTNTPGSSMMDFDIRILSLSFTVVGP